MKAILAFIFITIGLNGFCQDKELKVFEFSLPKEIEYYDNQFSGLYIQDGFLYLLSECRLQDKAEAKLYKIALADLDRQMKQSADTLPYQKIPIYGLQELKETIDADGSRYEGSEALVIKGNEIFISVETPSPDRNCYVFKGTLFSNRVQMSNIILPLPKPRLQGNKPVYNAGFEAMAMYNSSLIAFYEYNYFPEKSFAYTFSTTLNQMEKDSVKIKSLPFRITDITQKKGKHFVAINYFYKGSRADEVYRVAENDPNYHYTVQNGKIESFARLVKIKIGRKNIKWSSLGNLPKQYWAYNWEGIAAYKKGYFVMNDKYTPAKPYKTTLLFVY